MQSIAIGFASGYRYPSSAFTFIEHAVVSLVSSSVPRVKITSGLMMSRAASSLLIRSMVTSSDHCVQEGIISKRDVLLVNCGNLDATMVSVPRPFCLGILQVMNS